MLALLMRVKLDVHLLLFLIILLTGKFYPEYHTSTNGGNSFPYTITGSFNGSDSTTLNSSIWNQFSADPNSYRRNIYKYIITVTVPANSNSLIAYPIGNYIGTLTLNWYTGFNFLGFASCSNIAPYEQGTINLNANYIVPSLCQISSTSDINFGNIFDIGTSSKNYDSQGAISTICNSGTPYTVYLGDGNHRIPNSYRQMVNNGNYIPYQLYQDRNYSTVWDNLDGISNIASGIAQTNIVYGRIPSNQNIASMPGTYTDSVIVNVKY
ncbi:Spore coat protein U (SCPU) domain-containing protein [Acinetobacter boissieri]|uniref:Spore coat protein U (SCPU) domain-containing protein n=2 Tax=Acinetobacter boissieri TaxID=1219383 RepID=A0A1G6KG63_9GAMM|nr:Spore coat protein U (SCPU) domain-containing protein [Acinetobacter boissieri]